MRFLGMFDGPPQRKFACGPDEFQDLETSRIGRFSRRRGLPLPTDRVGRILT